MNGLDESILLSVKKLIGIDSEYAEFDTDIIMHINTVLNILTQLGVGPDIGFFIVDESDTWGDFLADEQILNLVKSYVCAKVRMLFDPPTSSSVTQAYNENIKELEWRINVTVDLERI